MARARQAVVDAEIERPASVSGDVVERYQADRAGERRCVYDDGVVLAVLAARVGSGSLQSGQQIERETPPEPRLVEHVFAHRHDAGVRTGKDEFAIQPIGGLAPEGLDGSQSAGCADALRELTVRVVHD